MTNDVIRDRWYTVAEVALAFNMSEETVVEWVRRGWIQYERAPNSDLMFTAKTLDAIRAVRATRVDRTGVYFIQCGEFVKIGYAADVDERFNFLAVANPQPLTLLHLLPHDLPLLAKATEVVLHARFASSRHRGEWFRLYPDIRRYLVEECGVALP